MEVVIVAAAQAIAVVPVQVVVVPLVAAGAAEIKMHKGPFIIPQISDDKLKELYSRIKPVIRFNNYKSTKDGLTVTPEKYLYYIQNQKELREVSYPWSAKKRQKATGLKEICRIKTLHEYGYYGFFKPSIAEVLAQIPTELLNLIVAFQVLGPDTAEDLNKEKDALNAGYHVAETILYIEE